MNVKKRKSFLLRNRTRWIKLTLATLACAILTICASSSASAYSYANALAVINYDSLEISFTGSGSIANESYSTYAELNGESASDSLESYLESSSESSWAWSETFDSESEYDSYYGGTYEDLYTETQDDSLDDNTYASATTLLSAMATADTDGILTISVDYWLAVDVMSVENYISLAISTISLSVGDQVVTDSLSVSTTDSLLSYGEETEWLTLTISEALKAGESVLCTLSAETFANANAVPVPGTGLLLSAGLLAVAAARRKN